MRTQIYTLKYNVLTIYSSISLTFLRVIKRQVNFFVDYSGTQGRSYKTERIDFEGRLGHREDGRFLLILTNFI